MRIWLKFVQKNAKIEHTNQRILYKYKNFWFGRTFLDDSSY